MIHESTARACVDTKCKAEYTTSEYAKQVKKLTVKKTKFDFF